MLADLLPASALMPLSARSSEGKESQHSPLAGSLLTVALNSQIPRAARPHPSLMIRQTHRRLGPRHKLLANTAVDLRAQEAAYGKWSPAKTELFWGSRFRFRCLVLVRMPGLRARARGVVWGRGVAAGKVSGAPATPTRRRAHATLR